MLLHCLKAVHFHKELFPIAECFHELRVAGADGIFAEWKSGYAK